jgi:hypothetical protein
MQQIANGSISQPPSVIFSRNAGSFQPESDAGCAGAVAWKSVEGMAEAGMDGAAPALKFWLIGWNCGAEVLG